MNKKWIGGAVITGIVLGFLYMMVNAGLETDGHTWAQLGQIAGGVALGCLGIWLFVLAIHRHKEGELWVLDMLIFTIVGLIAFIAGAMWVADVAKVVG